MKTIKRFLFIAACCVGTTAFGQNTGQMNADQRTDYINQHVADMTPDQQSKILVIERDYSSEIKAINSNSIDSLRRATDGKIRAVLSNTQYEQYQSVSANLNK